MKGLRKAVKSFTYTLAAKPAERCLVDLSRPKSVKSTGEKEYMMIGRDDVSRFTRVFFLRTKNETAMYFSTYLVEIAPCKVDVVRSDGGGEFSKGAFGARIYDSRSPTIQRCCWTPNRNRRGSRPCGKDSGSSQVLQRSLSARREFVGRASSLGLSRALNCTATSANPVFKSPHEMWFGSLPSSSPFPFLNQGFHSRSPTIQRCC